MEGARRPDSESEPDSFSELLSVCTGNLQKNLPRLCEIGCSSCVSFTFSKQEDAIFHLIFTQPGDRLFAVDG